MRGNMKIINVDGSIDAQELAGVPPLEVLQKAVGGYIERVPLFETYEGEPCFAFCDEDGKAKGLPINEEATVAWAEAVGLPIVSDALCGPVVIITGDKALLRKL